ncbi:hypothetical protein G6N76_00345 [Rhizobium daejeonense]|uniref:Uncharacterized protein n=1 Tax=Rhizobium daejeonense TaxID=240521 RepID=A0A6M1RKT3_9HYPH|nr:hypothetical protein [Rhizobium daejeonense]NGO62104.1 hypothetical protein [Rhizobium daejeonense]
MAVQDCKNFFMTISPGWGRLIAAFVPEDEGDAKLPHSQIHLSESRYRFFRMALMQAPPHKGGFTRKCYGKVNMRRGHAFYPTPCGGDGRQARGGFVNAYGSTVRGRF